MFILLEVGRRLFSGAFKSQPRSSCSQKKERCLPSSQQPVPCIIIFCTKEPLLSVLQHCYAVERWGQRIKQITFHLASPALTDNTHSRQAILYLEIQGISAMQTAMCHPFWRPWQEAGPSLWQCQGCGAPSLGNLSTSSLKSSCRGLNVFLWLHLGGRWADLLQIFFN